MFEEFHVILKAAGPDGIIRSQEEFFPAETPAGTVTFEPTTEPPVKPTDTDEPEETPSEAPEETPSEAPEETPRISGDTNGF